MISLPKTKKDLGTMSKVLNIKKKKKKYSKIVVWKAVGKVKIVLS